ncbi:extracellular serine-rich protein [Moelleriella libera RCEF 2490]|uniref:Extracellular serine-rich protein n=1 Tax=Moelleriella libera RCEF 2490 TaxID=1081109 RepID=A0A168A096_9HYPO|nr:extracellular serine-rich protein [Moelleriella libera RCEF 2490]
MYFAKLKLAVLSLLAAHANAKTIRINVGKEGLVFTPPSVTAEKGDVLEYHFYKMMHSVALGQFANGCTPATQGGFFSGVIRTAGDGPNPKVFRVTVNNTEPIAFYCTVLRHCQSGMVGVVNPPATDSLDKLKKVAAEAKNTTAPGTTEFGGTIVEGAGASASVSAGASASASADAKASASASASAGDSSSTSPSQASGTASGSQPSKTAAASRLRATLGGLGVAAAGFAALLI